MSIFSALPMTKSTSLDALENPSNGWFDSGRFSGTNMRHICFLILCCALGLCVFFTSEQAQAQSSSGTISIYTYRTVTTRLTNENERLSNVAVTERKNAAAADQRWRRAMLQLEEERASGTASAGRVAQLEKEAAADPGRKTHGEVSP